MTSNPAPSTLPRPVVGISSLIGGQNHAKIGVTTSGDKHHVTFGDLNQRGGIDPPHWNNDLFNTVTGLLEGESETVKAK